MEKAKKADNDDDVKKELLHENNLFKLNNHMCDGWEELFPRSVILKKVRLTFTFIFTPYLILPLNPNSFTNMI